MEAGAGLLLLQLILGVRIAGPQTLPAQRRLAGRRRVVAAVELRLREREDDQHDRGAR